MNLGLKGLNKIQCSVSQVMFGGRHLPQGIVCCDSRLNEDLLLINTYLGLPQIKIKLLSPVQPQNKPKTGQYTVTLTSRCNVTLLLFKLCSAEVSCVYKIR